MTAAELLRSMFLFGEDTGLTDAERVACETGAVAIKRCAQLEFALRLALGFIARPEGHKEAEVVSFILETLESRKVARNTAAAMAGAIRGSSFGEWATSYPAHWSSVFGASVGLGVTGP